MILFLHSKNVMPKVIRVEDSTLGRPILPSGSLFFRYFSSFLPTFVLRPAVVGRGGALCQSWREALPSCPDERPPPTFSSYFSHWHKTHLWFIYVPQSTDIQNLELCSLIWEKECLCDLRASATALFDEAALGISYSKYPRKQNCF
jgi:hypothetical protein